MNTEDFDQKQSRVVLPNPRLDEDAWYDELNSQIEELRFESNKNLFSHIAQIYRETTRRVDDFHVGIALQELMNEFWHSYCDVHLEAAKQHIYVQKDRETGEIISEPNPEAKIEAKEVLLIGLKTYLKMLHPFIPFITQRLWDEVEGVTGENLMYVKW